VTLAQLREIRIKMDTEHFWGTTFQGKKYRAVALCDPEVFARIHGLLEASGYLYAEQRGSDNPYFNVNTTMVYDEILYVTGPQLYYLRPSANSGASFTGCPEFGPSMLKDWRDYTVTSTLGLIIFCGKNAVVEGVNESVTVKDHWTKFDKSLQVAARVKHGALRGEWYAKDGRTVATAVRNYSVMCAMFYEPGPRS
jgi:hypothetical protein